MREAGHTFLARLGKKRLCPGGRRGTEWLMERGGFSPDKKVLEVACNMGTTTVELAKAYGCMIEAVDLDEKALEKARANIKANGLEDKVHLHQANAMNLSFDDETFDIVVNEAMLTMLPMEVKEKCVREYLRVLKKGGVLLTHDVMLRRDDEEVRREMADAIHVPATPLTEEKWHALMGEAGYVSIEELTDDMSLMSLDGMVYDEGWDGAMTILKNAMKEENSS